MKTLDPNIHSIPKDGYVAFDAMSLRQLIVDRLNEQQVFTDQNFIGSNLASIIDIISFSYHTLIYYLNKTSTESMFTESQLYENMNRIVKMIDYKPIGYQTSTLSFNASAQNLPQGIYAIPRYTSVSLNGITFSFNEDVALVKTIAMSLEALLEMSRLKLLYQGQYQEYPLYTATGENNELIIVNTTDTLVDHFNFDVYVKTKQFDVWKKYTQTQNLFLEDSLAEKYEIRLNSNKRYEIKFGNDINGKKLQAGDKVAIYYLESSGENGVVGESFTTSDVRKYNTPQFLEILEDVNNEQLTYLENNQLTNLIFKNSASSTLPKQPETTEEIRELAPALYRSQYRLVTAMDYEVYVKANFSNIVSDVKAFNNWTYTSQYLKYFYDIGITNPFLTERALLNQVLYTDSTNFNNAYIIIVPRATAYSNYNFLSPAQKELITTSILSTKMTTTETTFVDPVYKAFDFGVPGLTNVETDICTLVIRKSVSSRANDDMIKNAVVNIIKEHFSRTVVKLGQLIDITSLAQQIQDIPGVDTYKIVREDTGEQINGLCFQVWNPIYPENDVNTTQTNIQLKNFEYPYFYNLEFISSKIKIVSSYGAYEPVEY
jgi:hypothetical protein